jgi:hypothetical protein
MNLISTFSSQVCSPKQTKRWRSRLLRAFVACLPFAAGVALVMDANAVSNTNTFYGTGAGRNVSGSFDTAFGYDALFSPTTGNFNTAAGWEPLYENTGGSSNTAVGSGALYENSTGSYNIAVGLGSLFYNTTGSNNTALGLWAPPWHWLQ